MLWALAAMMAARRRGLWAGSGSPSLADTVISRESLENSLERWASCLFLRNMMFLNWEWPAMAVLPKLIGGQIAGLWPRFKSRIFRKSVGVHPEGGAGGALMEGPWPWLL